MIIRSLLLFVSCFILQRYDGLGTSLGLLVLAVLWGWKTLWSADKKLSRGLKGGILRLYPLFILPFLLASLPVVCETGLDPLKPFIAPLLAWWILLDPEFIDRNRLCDKKILGVIFLALACFLVRDMQAMMGSGVGAVKKIYGFGNPNYTAFLIIVLELFYFLNLKIPKALDYMFLLCCVLMIGITFSKTAYMIQVFILIFVFSRRWFLAILITGVCAFVVAAIRFDFSEIFRRAGLFFESDLGNAFMHRSSLTKCAIAVFSDFPWFGCGYGRFPEISYQQYGNFSELKTHNILLTLFAETGVFGTMFFAATCYGIALQLRRRMNLPVLLVLAAYLGYSVSHADGESLVQLPLLLRLVDDLVKENRNMGLESEMQRGVQ